MISGFSGLPKLRQFVAATGVARGVADDGGEDARELVGGRGAEVGPREHEDERVLDGIERVLGSEAFCPGDRGGLARVAVPR